MAKNWFPSHSPGTFQVAVNGALLDPVFGKGATDDWVWESAGEVALAAGSATVSLKDLSGYYGRCDALILTTDRDYTPPLAEKADSITTSGCLMGGALNYRAENQGKPVDYTPPEWAAKLPPPERFNRRPKHFRGGQWWMEHRGTIDDLYDAEKARDELLRIVFGYWNRIKHHSEYRDEARTYAITHIPIVEAKRESRRLFGDVILTQNDVCRVRAWTCPNGRGAPAEHAPGGHAADRSPQAIRRDPPAPA